MDEKKRQEYLVQQIASGFLGEEWIDRYDNRIIQRISMDRDLRGRIHFRGFCDTDIDIFKRIPRRNRKNLFEFFDLFFRHILVLNSTRWMNEYILCSFVSSLNDSQIIILRLNHGRFYWWYSWYVEYLLECYSWRKRGRCRCRYKYYHSRSWRRGQKNT